MSPRADRPITVTRKVHRRRRRARALMAITVVAAVVAATGYGAWQFIEENEYLLDERCQVTLGETEHRLTPAQTYSAAHLAAGAADRDMPVQAATHALAISLQEAQLEDHADPEDAEPAETDSSEAEESAEAEEDQAPVEPVLFAGGGAQWDAVEASSTVPRTSADFYQELSDSSRGEGEAELEWSPELGLDEAAEALSRPHNPTFYPQHGELARAFARPLTGMQPLVMTCQLSQIDVPGPDPQGLAEELGATLPNLLGEDAVAVEGSGESGTVTVGIEDVDAEAGVHDPVTEASSEDRTDPLWLVAHWAVAAAETYGVQSVHAGTHEWQRDSGRWERVEEASDEAVEISFSRP
ncbi:hypothetical protein [Nesterenkonia lutea]|uniref:Heavy metal transporter n=1 Tax=Nesterenkonia lutea TaxID=272919 RepID=A0ABR9JFC8_9MICC|nr:hypothetical protein [Nesterenkonia lutea]MBE1524473.1 hypothetical protein [Nesterenkonia lutea]